MVLCEHCQEVIGTDQDVVEYDQLPFHRDCMKEMFREDNPNLPEEKYEEFDKKADLVDKFERSGEVLIPVAYEKSGDEGKKDDEVVD